jgi:hypothetical protein
MISFLINTKKATTKKAAKEDPPRYRIEAAVQAKQPSRTRS